MTYDVAIAGGGVIGLVCAYYLAEAGAKVVLLERGRTGQEASWAAAGMLAVAAEMQQPGPFTQLCLASRARYSELVTALYAETGIDCELTSAGLIRVARDPEEATRLQEQLNWQQGQGLSGEWLDTDELKALEPQIKDTLCGGVRFADDRQINNRKLLEALYAACIQRGVDVREHCEVVGVDRVASGRCNGWRTLDGVVAAGRLVLATGAWSARAGAWLGVQLPVRPIRGQIVELRLPRNLRHIVFAQGTCYLVPKAGSRLLLGATAEDAGFTKRTTAGALAGLVEQAASLVPAVAEAEWRTAWAGLRPRAGDDLPILGPLPEHPEVVLATGHYRNGILLTPITGLVVKSLVLGQPVPVNWRPCGVQRFGRRLEAAG